MSSLALSSTDVSEGVMLVRKWAISANAVAIAPAPTSNASAKPVAFISSPEVTPRRRVASRMRPVVLTVTGRNSNVPGDL